MSAAQHPILSADDIESRAWQINELFRVIDDAHPGASNGEISICTLANLGSQLCTELAEYASNQRKTILDMAVKPGHWRNDPDSIIRSYCQTVEGAEALMRAVSAADLKRVPAAQRKAIADALQEMEGHCCVAHEDFLDEAAQGGPTS